MNNFFEIKNFSLILDTFKIKGISFTLNKGDYLTVIGPTGAGKTILLESILGIHKLNTGKIFLKNREITKLPPEKRKIGIIYQDYALFPHLTVKKNIKFGLKENDNEKIHTLCDFLNITHLLNRLPETLSGGEKQRVALARALAVKPELLLMDEPFAALDNRTKFKTRQMLRKIVGNFNITVIHITHDFDDVWSLANKVAIIKEGELLQLGSIEEIMFKPKNEFIAEFTDTNIIEGKVVAVKENLSVISANGVFFKSADMAKVGEKVKIAVRPESIIVFKENRVNLSARNILKAKLTDYFIENRVYHLILSLGGLKLKAVLTNAAFDDLNLRKGNNINLIIKATNVRIV